MSFSSRRRLFRYQGKKLFFFSLLFFLLLGCGNKPAVKKHTNGFDEKYMFNAAEYQHFLQNRFNHEDFSFRIPDSTFEFLDTLKYFYASRGFQPIFIKSFDDKFLIDSLLKIIKKAEDHGINPEVFNYNLLKSEYAKIYDTALTTNSARYIHMANVELLSSNTILSYAYHMRYGVVNPASLYSDSYCLPVVDSAKREVAKPLYEVNTLNYLNEIQPKSTRYKSLQKALAFFRNLESLTWDRVFPINKKLKLGERTSQLIPIIERLAVLGFIDTSKIPQKTFDIYDSVLIKAVAKFQAANGLPNDGAIGKATVEKLSVPPKEYVEKIIINLERFRWTSYDDSSRYILVNIPDFYLRVIENKAEKLKIKVCTGNKRPPNYKERLQLYEKTKNWRNKPNDWETPQVYAQITHLVLNPTWTVPTSIIRDEIYRKTLADSNYLRGQNFKVIYKGKEMNIDEVNLKQFSPNNVPYIFVQDPGAGNALGRIKFMFTNRFDIYLHDTPTRAPFSVANRAVSHGCVRVEKPMLLSDYILKNNATWAADFVRIETGFPVTDKTKIAEFKSKRNELRRNCSFGKTTQVTLNHSFPLYIDYFTAWVESDGVINFRDDVYRKDEPLKKILCGRN